VLVDFADGRAATAGIQPGDLILQINNAEVSSAAQFNGLVGQARCEEAGGPAGAARERHALCRHQAASISKHR
jgi:S1-C subfamily serine protease